jgi:hypothetical protein
MVAWIDVPRNVSPASVMFVATTSAKTSDDYIQKVESERDKYKEWAYRFRDLLEPFAWLDGIDHPNDTEKAIIEFDEENDNVEGREGETPESNNQP